MDPRWSLTFPHLVAPYNGKDESFIGFLLRCDEINSWPSGATLGLFQGDRIQRTVTDLKIRRSLMAMLVYPPVNIEELASALSVPAADVWATTYLDELYALYPDSQGHFNYHRLGENPRLQVCPICIGDDANLMRRTHLLPGISVCPVHHVWLHQKCACGSWLDAFPSGPVREVGEYHQRLKPFTCTACKRAWKDLPRDRADTPTLQLQKRLAGLYAMFLTKPSVEIYKRALELLQTIS